MQHYPKCLYLVQALRIVFHSLIDLFYKLIVEPINPFRKKRKVLDSSKLKEIADDNFKFDVNGGKFSERVEKRCEKSRTCLLRAISPFPTEFSKDLYSRHIKTRACLGNVNSLPNNLQFEQAFHPFHHNVFYHIKDRNHHFSNINFVVWKILSIWSWLKFSLLVKSPVDTGTLINSLPHNPDF